MSTIKVTDIKAADGTSALTIADSSGNVGIGVTSISTQGNLYIGASGTSTDAKIGLSATNSGGGQNPLAQIGSSADGTYGSTLYFNTRSTGGTIAEHMRITSSGDVELKTTNAKLILPTGGGISFENHSTSTATGASSTASANVLDDYEEGTWTCSVVGQSATATGRYVKIGELVHVEVVFTCDTTVTTGTASQPISGLPFPASSTTRCLLNFFAYNLRAVSGASSAPTISTSIGPSFVLIVSNIGSIHPLSSTASNPYYLENIFQNGSLFRMNGTYRIS